MKKEIKKGIDLAVKDFKKKLIEKIEKMRIKFSMYEVRNETTANLEGQVMGYNQAIDEVLGLLKRFKKEEK